MTITKSSFLIAVIGITLFSNAFAEDLDDCGSGTDARSGKILCRRLADE